MAPSGRLACRRAPTCVTRTRPQCVFGDNSPTVESLFRPGAKLISRCDHNYRQSGIAPEKTDMVKTARCVVGACRVCRNRLMHRSKAAVERGSRARHAEGRRVSKHPILPAADPGATLRYLRGLAGTRRRLLHAVPGDAEEGGARTGRGTPLRAGIVTPGPGHAELRKCKHNQSPAYAHDFTQGSSMINAHSTLNQRLTQ